MSVRIAVTGGIAEGKSTILGWLREEGYLAASSDEAARELFGKPWFNERLAEIVAMPAPVSPANVREAMLGSDTIRRAVNRFTHPEIGAWVKAQGAMFVEVPLLIEACLQDEYDEVWVAFCGEEEQRRRLMARYNDSSLVEALLRVQLPSKVRTVFADRIIRTNTSPEHVRSSLMEAVRDAVR